MMKNFESTFLNKINSVFAFIQSKTDLFRQKSLFLSNLDVLIFAFIALTLISSIFAGTNVIGDFAFFVPVLVFIKFIFTKGEKIEFERCNFYLLLYLVICFITNFTSSLMAQSFYGFFKTFIYIAFYFSLCQFLKSNKKYIPLILLLIACLISIEAFIGLKQNFIHVASLATWQDLSYSNPEDVLSRVFGTLKPLNPNLLAGYMVAGISSILAVSLMAFNAKRYKVGCLALIMFFVSSFTVFLTGCRGAYLALFVMYICIALASFQLVFKHFNNEKLKLIWKKSAAVCSGGVVLFLLLNHKIVHRIMSIFLLRGDSSTSFRMNVYHASWQMFQDNPIFGIGVGNKVFREIYGLYMLSNYTALSSYCVFLEMAVESGIFALIAYLLFLASLLKAAIKNFIISEDLKYKILILISTISIIAVMIHGFFDTIYFRPQVQFVFWTMAAILVVLTKNYNSDNCSDC